MRATRLILALILACGDPVSVPDPGPIEGDTSARPALRGNRLVAPRPDAGAGTLEVTVTSPVAPGDTATASARVSAGARCTIEVTYRSGPSEAQGLDPVTVGEDGAISWTWIVGINTTPGDWVVGVECVAPDGSRAQGHGLLTVRQAGSAPTGSVEAGR